MIWLVNKVDTRSFKSLFQFHHYMSVSKQVQGDKK